MPWVRKAKLEDSTIKRYQSWIRRYLRYFSANKIQVTDCSVLSFLKTYENQNTRRQEFYALRLFYIKGNKEKRVYLPRRYPAISSEKEKKLFCMVY